MQSTKDIDKALDIPLYKYSRIRLVQGWDKLNVAVSDSYWICLSTAAVTPQSDADVSLSDQGINPSLVRLNRILCPAQSNRLKTPLKCAFLGYSILVLHTSTTKYRSCHYSQFTGLITLSCLNC